MGMNIDELIAKGCVQLSRKYRLLGLLPPGKTGLEALQEIDPREADRILEQANEQARSAFLGRSPAHHIELTCEEFNEYLVKTGRSPAPIGPACSGCQSLGDQHGRDCPNAT